MSTTEFIEEPATVLTGEDIALIKGSVDEKYPDLFGLYMKLHSTPELSGQEILTSRCIASELRSAGFQVTEGVGGYGVVGVFINGDGPTVMVRADLDGLPIEEKTGLPYAAKTKGILPGKGETCVMHACGHDVHMAVLAGTARILTLLRERWRGTLVFIGQPAEEVGAGARAMINDGLYTRFPRPDFALALHVAPSLPVGTVGVREALFWAGCSSLEILIRGVGGHGSRPHETKDPIVLSAETVMLLQTIVSREIDPAETAVLTVGAIHGGTKGNIIPEEVSLQVNYRYFTPETDRILRAAIERTARGAAIAAGIPENRMPVVTEQYSGPPVFNDPELTRRLTSAFRGIIGKENVLRTERYTYSDDFSQFGLDEPGIPSCYFLLGTANQVEGGGNNAAKAHAGGIHNPSFAPEPEPTIKTGVKAMSAAVLEALARQKGFKSTR